MVFLLSTYSMLQDVLRLGKNERDISRLAIIVKADIGVPCHAAPAPKFVIAKTNPFAKYKR